MTQTLPLILVGESLFPGSCFHDEETLVCTYSTYRFRPRFLLRIYLLRRLGYLYIQVLLQQSLWPFLFIRFVDYAKLGFCSKESASMEMIRARVTTTLITALAMLKSFKNIGYVLL